MKQKEELPLHLQCALAGTCSGCLLITEPYPEQLKKKSTHLADLFKEAGVSLDAVQKPPTAMASSVHDVQGFFSIITIDVGHLRDKADLTLQELSTDPGTSPRHRLGLYEINGRAVVDMPLCPQMSPTLENWLKDFRKTLVNLKAGQLRLGSVRLRVSPDGRRGAWLDLANTDVKTLLDDESWLKSLLELGTVEVGQRRKRLTVKEGRLKLGDPVQEAWFETYLGNAIKAPLYSSIAGFSQPGFRANEALVTTLKKVISKVDATKWLELFCGNGNFTLPLVALGKTVTAFELDPAATEGLQKTANELNLGAKLQVIQGDAYRSRSSPVNLGEYNALLVDPPRSGLKQVLDWLSATKDFQRPPHLVYVSCHGVTLAQDSRGLQNLGYQLRELQGVDQFAQSPHAEWIARFERILNEK